MVKVLPSRQSCNSPWHLSNDRSQAYISTKMKRLWLLKDLEDMAQVPQGNVCPKYFCNHSHLIIVFIYSCDLSLERSRRELQLFSWKHFNQNSYAKLMINKKFKHICSPRNMATPPCNLSFSPPCTWLLLRAT